MSIIINPGTGTVAGTQGQARSNVAVFAQDVAARHGYDLGTATINFRQTEDDGRFTFDLTFGELTFEVEMPGLPIETVRWVDGPDQNIWDFPRLYVNGSSWVWKYAVNACQVHDG